MSNYLWAESRQGIASYRADHVNRCVCMGGSGVGVCMYGWNEVGGGGVGVRGGEI